MRAAGGRCARSLHQWWRDIDRTPTSAPRCCQFRVICPAPQPASRTTHATSGHLAGDDSSLARIWSRPFAHGCTNAAYRGVRGQTLPDLGSGAIEIVFDPIACGVSQLINQIPDSSKMSRSFTWLQVPIASVPPNEGLGQARCLLPRASSSARSFHLEQGLLLQTLTGGSRRCLAYGRKRLKPTSLRNSGPPRWFRATGWRRNPPAAPCSCQTCACTGGDDTVHRINAVEVIGRHDQAHGRRAARGRQSHRRPRRPERRKSRHQCLPADDAA